MPSEPSRLTETISPPASAGQDSTGHSTTAMALSKAGGPDYLMNFVESVVVTENTVRHGLPLEQPSAVR
jgi:hypothetical protein